VAAKLDVHRNAVGAWEQGSVLPKSKGIVLELARVLHLDDVETRQLLEASLTALAPYWVMPYQRNPFFTGRKEILEELHRRLVPDQVIALTQSHALSGLGGIGKTQIVIEYAYRHALSYSAIFWIGAETVETIIADYVRIAEVLQLPKHQEVDQQQVVAAVQHWLSTHRDWLLIWDNVEDLELLSRFMPIVRQGAILITTRMRALGMLAQSFELPVMAQEEGMLLLLRRAKILSPEAIPEQMDQFALRAPGEYAAARELVTLMAGLPLALDQAAAYIEETGCNFTSYLQHYEHYSAQLLDRRGTSDQSHPQSVTVTFRLSSQHVKRRDPAAAELLRLCAFLHPEAIPEELLQAGVAQHDPLVAGPYHFDLAIAALRNLSLVQRYPETHTVSIHRLVQAIIRDSMDIDDTKIWIERIIRALNATFPEPDLANWPRCERYIPHVHAAFHLLSLSDSSLAEATSVFYRAGIFLKERASYTEAEIFLMRALTMQEQQWGGDHPSLVPTLNHVAVLSWHRGRYEQTKLLLQRALKICEQQGSALHSQTAECLTNLAEFYRVQGQPKRAERLSLRALRISERHAGAVHLQTAECLTNVAQAYRSQGKYQQAASLLQRSLSIHEQLLGPDHPETALCLGILGSVYREQGEYEQAECLLQRALVIMEERWGSDHFQTANCLNILGGLYQLQGKHQQAESFFERHLTIIKQLCGPEHINTALAMWSLGTLHAEQGKYEQARFLLQRALDIQRQQLKPNQLQIATSLESLGVLYRDEGRYEQAKPLLEQALRTFEEQIGPDHPKTARCLTKLAKLYERQGSYEQAGSLLRRAHTAFNQRFGQSHPETVKAGNAYHNLLEQRKSSTEVLLSERQEQALPLQGRSLHTDLAQNLFSEEAPETDALAAFLTAYCERHPRAFCRASDLWQAYERWAREAQERFPLSRRAFGTQLKAHGCRAGRTKNARIWHGITLR
jgi:tetratricopeptide (TPR) repeat protein